MAEETKTADDAVESSQSRESDNSESTSLADLFRRGPGAQFASLFEEEGGEGAGEEGAQKGEQTEGAAADAAPAEDKSESEPDQALEELKRQLALTDAEKAKLAQEAQFLKKSVAEIDPLVQLGIAVQRNPELLAYVRDYLQGGGQAQAKGKGGAPRLTPAQFMGELRSMVREEMSGLMDAHSGAQRELNEVDSRARKELENFDVLSKHPTFMGWVNVFDNAIEERLVELPQGENRTFFAMKKAYETLLASNPDYVKAVRDLGKAEGKASTAKKLAASTLGAAGKSAADATGGKAKLTEDERDRLNMLGGYLRAGGARRLPSARR